MGMIKRFKVEKITKGIYEGEYHIIDRDMENIKPNRLVARCSYINADIVCDALNIQYNLTKEDREKYNLIPKSKRNENTKKSTRRTRKG